MEAIILAGGLGTRLKQVVPNLPKPMAPVAGRPFLEILLSSLSSKGFSRIILSLGFKAERIISYFGDRFQNLEIIYEVETSPLGTGGAMRAALQHARTHQVFVFNGDTFLDLEIAEIAAFWKQNDTPIIVAREVSDAARYGRINVVADQVTGFQEKGVSGCGLINAGCYLIPRNLLDSMDIGESFSFETDFLVEAVKHKRFCVFVTHGFFIDIGIPVDYTRAQTELVRFIELYE